MRSNSSAGVRNLYTQQAESFCMHLADSSCVSSGTFYSPCLCRTAGLSVLSSSWDIFYLRTLSWMLSPCFCPAVSSPSRKLSWGASSLTTLPIPGTLLIATDIAVLQGVSLVCSTPGCPSETSLRVHVMSVRPSL